MQSRIFVTLVLSSALAACSTAPRNFAPQIAAPIADDSAFAADYGTCAALVAQGRTSGFKGAAVAAGATGAGAFGATAGAAALGGVGITGLSAAASFAIPGVGLLAGFGASRAIRASNERKFKRRMATCLGEYGYQVADWGRIRRRDDAATVALAASRPDVATRAPAPAGGTP